MIFNGVLERKQREVQFLFPLLFFSFLPFFPVFHEIHRIIHIHTLKICKYVSLANTCNLQIENYLNITINSRRIAIIRNMNIFLERKILPISFFFIIFLYFYIFRNTLYHCCLNIVIILQYFYCQYLQSNCYASLNK